MNAFVPLLAISVAMARGFVTQPRVMGSTSAAIDITKAPYIALVTTTDTALCTAVILSAGSVLTSKDCVVACKDSNVCRVAVGTAKADKFDGKQVSEFILTDPKDRLGILHCEVPLSNTARAISISNMQLPELASEKFIVSGFNIIKGMKELTQATVEVTTVNINDEIFIKTNTAYACGVTSMTNEKNSELVGIANSSKTCEQNNGGYDRSVFTQTYPSKKWIEDNTRAGSKTSKDFGLRAHDTSMIIAVILLETIIIAIMNVAFN